MVTHWDRLSGPSWGAASAQHVKYDFWVSNNAAVFRSDLQSLGPVDPALRRLDEAFAAALSDYELGYRKLAESWEPSGSYQVGVEGNALARAAETLDSHARTLAHEPLCP